MIPPSRLMKISLIQTSCEMDSKTNQYVAQCKVQDSVFLSLEEFLPVGMYYSFKMIVERNP